MYLFLKIVEQAFIEHSHLKSKMPVAGGWREEPEAERGVITTFIRDDGEEGET